MLIEAFKSDGFMLQRQRHRIGGMKWIFKTQHRQQAERRAGRQVERGGNNIDACALGTHQGARYVEVVLRQKLIQVVA